MSRTVFILGAGASAEAGAPVMGNFLEVAERLRHGVGGRYEPDFDRVFRARAQLQAVHSKARLDLENLESVFAAIEMASLRGALGTLSDADVLRLPAAMRFLIARTLEVTLKWRSGIEAVTKTAFVESPEPYDRFAALIAKRLHPSTQPQKPRPGRQQCNHIQL